MSAPEESDPRLIGVKVLGAGGATTALGRHLAKNRPALGKTVKGVGRVVGAAGVVKGFSDAQKHGGDNPMVQAGAGAMLGGMGAAATGKLKLVRKRPKLNPVLKWGGRAGMAAGAGLIAKGYGEKQ